MSRLLFIASVLAGFFYLWIGAHFEHMAVLFPVAIGIAAVLDDSKQSGPIR